MPINFTLMVKFVLPINILKQELMATFNDSITFHGIFNGHFMAI